VPAGTVPPVRWAAPTTATCDYNVDVRFTAL
jgi:hypothetical protein